MSVTGLCFAGCFTAACAAALSTATRALPAPKPPTFPQRRPLTALQKLWLDVVALQPLPTLMLLPPATWTSALGWVLVPCKEFAARTTSTRIYL